MIWSVIPQPYETHEPSHTPDPRAPASLLIRPLWHALGSLLHNAMRSHSEGWVQWPSAT